MKYCRNGVHYHMQAQTYSHCLCLYVYVCIYGLFNDAIISWGSIVSYNTVNNELERIWNESVVS
jgi:hypothetical protein